jgi:tRNA-2-methylthio-N6-dimethylallyladenosine synthase
MEHVHLPIQSGDNEILTEMKRVYTVESYRDIVQELRETVPGIGITTDVIVGFPGETDAQFEATLSVFQELRFDGAYMFAYSTRPGTPAGDRTDQVPEPVKRARLNRLIDAQNTITREINGSLIGKTMEVLVEGPSPKDPTRMQGYSREFRMVNFPASTSRAGRIARVTATSAHQWGLGGELSVA